MSADRSSEVAQEFAEFFRSGYTRLAQAAYLLTRSEAEAEDVAQEAFARVYQRWSRVAGMRSAEGYLYKVALNLVRKRYRRSRAPEARAAPSEVPDPATSVAEQDRILRALDGLSRTQREAVVLVDWLDMTAEDAGRLLGVEATSIRVRLHRARARLRDTLGGHHE